MDRLLVFCLLDRALPYEKVCKAFEALDSKGLTTKDTIKAASLKEIVDILKSTGFRFPNQTGKFIKDFGETEIDLKTASREELTKIKGIGMKLASMFLRDTRGEEYAVIDIHIKNFLKERGQFTNNYLKDEVTLKEIAKKMELSIAELDFIIWESRRIGNRKKER